MPSPTTACFKASRINSTQALITALHVVKTQLIPGDGLNFGRRVERHSQSRSYKRLLLLDSFAVLINGPSLCTAVTLVDHELVVATNHGQSDVVKKFALFLLEGLQNPDVNKPDLFKECIQHNKQRLIKKTFALRPPLRKRLTKALETAFRAVETPSAEFNQSAPLPQYLAGQNDLADNTSTEKLISLIDGAEVTLKYVNKLDHKEYRELKQFCLVAANIQRCFNKLVGCVTRFRTLGFTAFRSITGVKVIPSIPEIAVKWSSDLELDMDEVYDRETLVAEIQHFPMDRDNISVVNVALDDKFDILIREENKRLNPQPVHCELQLAIYLMQNGVHDGAIGVSKLSCGLCGTYLTSLSIMGLADYALSGTHGKIYKSWGFPELPSEFPTLKECHSDDIILTVLALVLSIISLGKQKNEDGDGEYNADEDAASSCGSDFTKEIRHLAEELGDMGVSQNPVGVQGI